MAGSARAPQQRLVLVSAALCVVASALLLFAPTGVASLSGSGTTRSEVIGGGRESETAETRSLVGEISTADLIFFAVPVVIAAAPLTVRRGTGATIVRSIAAGLLFLWVLFLAFGGGIFYMPSALLMAIAAVVAGTRSR